MNVSQNYFKLEAFHLFYKLKVALVCAVLTCFTMYSCKSSVTAGACVPIDLIIAGAGIQARTTGTFIDIWKYNDKCYVQVLKVHG